MEKGKIFLAPLAGYTDVGFRTICAECGADLTFTEMLSSAAMVHDSKKTEDMTIRDPKEGAVFAQIFGNDELVMAQAVTHPILQKFDGIDINMGCPAHKIVKNGEGAALLKDLAKAGRILSGCVKASGERPVSVKVRLGFERENISEIVRMAQESGAKFITIHGRTFQQGFGGKVDYELIAKAKALSSIPVIGNGDVTSFQSYEAMLQTGVDGVMIGRGAVGAPWIFSELKGENDFDRFSLVKRHVEILRKYYPEKWLVMYLRKHFLAYASSFKAGSEIKRTLALQTDIDQSLKLLKDAANHFEM